MKSYCFMTLLLWFTSYIEIVFIVISVFTTSLAGFEAHFYNNKLMGLSYQIQVNHPEPSHGRLVFSKLTFYILHVLQTDSVHI
jgi:hypothetical protein